MMMTTPPTPPTSPTETAPGAAPPHANPAALPPPSARAAVAATLRKELRQNLPVASCILASVILTYLSTFLDTSAPSTQINILVLPGVGMFITGLCALGGFALGVSQPLHERNFDLWAYLTHRPVPRTALFAGRVLAGLILYAAVVVLPIVVVVLYGMTSAGGPYFQPFFLQPIAADLLNGLLFYFAGLLCAERPAFLLGSRGLPLVAAFAVALLAAFVYSLALALALEALGVVLLLAAAWGSAVSHGYALPRATPRPATAALAAILLIALSAILTFAALPLRSALSFWADAAVADLHPPHLRMITTSLRTFDDGTPVRETAITDLKTVSTFTDLDGHPLPAPDPASLRHTDADAVTLTPSLTPRFSYRLPAARVEVTPIGYVSNDVPHELWFATQPPSTIQGFSMHPVGEKNDVGDPLGTLGKNGFIPANAGAAQPFTGAAVEGFSWPADATTLYAISFSGHAVRLLYTAPPGEYLRASAIQNIGQEATATAPRTEYAIHYIATDKSLAILDRSNRVMRTVPLSHNLADGWMLTVHNGSNVGSKPRLLSLWYARGNTTDIDTFDASDARHSWHIDAAQTVTTDPPFNGPPDLISTLNITHAAAGLLDALAFPFAASLQQSLGAPPPDKLPSVTPDWLILPDLSATDRTWHIIGLVLSAIGAALVARRYRSPWWWAWAITGLLLGPAAILAVIALRWLPRKIKCPSCKKSRTVFDRRCPHCQSAHAPAITGTEVFA